MAATPGRRAANLPPLGPALSIDVIIPARNRAHFLPACLDSVFAQDHPAQAIWLVDDGSTDGTATLLADYARRHPRLHVIRTPGVGVSAARNLALKRSTADLVAFIDSDDTWHPRFLSALRAVFLAGPPSLGFVNCGLRQIDARGEQARHAPDLVPSRRGNIFPAILEQFYPIAPSTLMARRDLVLEVGGFDETLVQAEDRDLCLKLADISDADFSPEILVGLRQHDQNTYGQAMRTDPEFVLFQRLRVWNRWLDRIERLDAVVKGFRAEAVSAGRFSLRRRLDFGLYDRLERSGLDLARQLFSSRADYLRALLNPASRTVRPTLGARVKSWLALRVIRHNGRLLRLVQKMGRLRGMEPPPRRGRGG